MKGFIKQCELWAPWASSGIKTADATIKASTGLVSGIIACDDGSADLEIEIKNDTTTLLRFFIDVSEDQNGIYWSAPNPGVLFDTNIKLDITGGSAPEVIVLYK